MEITPPPGPDFSPEEAAATCSAPLHPQAVIGLQLFERGLYFEAHEALETAWREEPEPGRELYRGILQVAVAYHHLLRGNYPGTVRLLERALGWLAPFPQVCRGVQVEALRADAQRLLDEVRRLGAERVGLVDRAWLRPPVWKTHP